MLFGNHPQAQSLTITSALHESRISTGMKTVVVQGKPRLHWVACLRPERYGRCPAATKTPPELGV